MAIKKTRNISSWLLVVWIVATILLIGYGALAMVKTNLNTKILYRMGLIEAPEGADIWAIRGWEASLRSLNEDVDIVFLGNSITCGGRWEEYFPDRRVCNLGYPGDEIGRMLRRVPSIGHLHPEKIFLMGGINGLKYMSASKFREQYTALVDSIKAVAPEAELYVQSILPVSKDSYLRYDNQVVESNAIIEEIAAEKGLEYIDLYSIYVEHPELFRSDGVHLDKDKAGYDPWVERIRGLVYDTVRAKEI